MIGRAAAEEAPRHSAGGAGARADRCEAEARDHQPEHGREAEGLRGGGRAVPVHVARAVRACDAAAAGQGVELECVVRESEPAGGEDAPRHDHRPDQAAQEKESFLMSLYDVFVPEMSRADPCGSVWIRVDETNNAKDHNT